jgi:hypothetical protein
VDDKKPQEQLQKEVAEIEKHLTVGKTYCHYKDPSKLYKILHFAFLEANNELVVIYRAQYGAGMVFVRPAKEWLDKVDWQGKTAQRFTPVD